MGLAGEKYGVSRWATIFLLYCCSTSHALLLGPHASPRKWGTARELVGWTRRGSTAEAGRGKLFALPSGFTLDRSAIPRCFAMVKDGNSFALMFMFTILLTRLIPRKVSVNLPAVSFADVERFLWPMWLQGAIEAVKSPIVRFAVFVKLCLKVVLAKTFLLVSSILGAVERTLDLNPAEETDIKDWNVCVLEERESLSGGIIKYRLSLPNPSATVPLYVGQELTLCLVDARDRALKETHFPVSTNNARGYFDILVRRGGSEMSPFVRSLETLALGDELAFKGGRYRLNYLGQDDPISSMTVVTSGLGIAPGMQMLRGILSDRDSTVEDIELLWLNEKQGDFVCEDDVEALELRHIEKLVVTRVIENDIYGRDLLKNDQIQDAVSPYEEGRVAVICAPDYIASTLRTLFQDLGYPPENILSIVQN